jgi:hypothetical protein
MHATEEDARYLDAILCALIRRAGGTIVLPIAEIRDVGNAYGFRVKPDRKAMGLVLGVQADEESVTGH